jgi:hypothetical protein
VPEEAPIRPRKHPKEDDKKLVREFGLGYQLVLELLGYLLVCGYAGRWLGERYGWKSQGLFWGLIVALVAWVYRILRVTRGMFR